MDGVIGEVIQVLKEKGMYSNSLIFFNSDNGGPIYYPGGGNNYPLKGTQYCFKPVFGVDQKFVLTTSLN